MFPLPYRNASLVFGMKEASGSDERDADRVQGDAGEIITTGTLTQALPIARGEAWTTGLAGIALDPIGVTFI